ncbi:SDR family oxidoreductase [Croceibacter atlanticus]|jgi:3-oxoacyl-[acyl-carrier protein] reductase|uniref:Short chain dehydrogenase n=1 Tax=Croceibacter atlanticus (strain ATCC BAA-628 / JCM 21780 / CIP 108009 / IAM 15332 / KCTC 12090 / HTCC2559) TaxID=216432 RepID=A3U9J8_CROAH|nr:SDR family oxidoreductase [Croceibacter atlanticus]EAP86484.1 short chain dehydrogenase [Croceibacter atlanticus HTCC2559]
MENLQDKVALITGGSKGIGFGIAESFLKQGMKVAVTSRSLTNAEDVAKELNAKYEGKAIGIKADVRNYIDQQEAVRKTVDTFGSLDVLIANAGLGHFGSIEEITDKEWKEVIDTNLTGVFYSIKSAVDELKKSKGYFISISSLAGTNFFAGGSAYNASKFGVTGFTQAVMLDLRQNGIKVSTIMPGSVATHFNGHTPNEDDAWKIQKEDLGQLTVDLLKMPENALPSKVEIRPTTPPSK